MTKDFWEKRYAGDAYVYGVQPNVFLTSRQDDLHACMKALAVADGEGRNAVWLAEQGMDVSMVDYSENALAKARRLAAERGVNLQTIHADLTEWQWPRGEFDLLTAIFAHFPSTLRRRLHHAARGALKPGGLLIMEAFNPNQLQYRTGGPSDPDMLYSADMLREDFADCNILCLEETITNLDEGSYHFGYAAVVRLVLQAPLEGN